MDIDLRRSLVGSCHGPTLAESNALFDDKESSCAVRHPVAGTDTVDFAFAAWLR
jgi:hypothetical protein